MPGPPLIDLSRDMSAGSRSSSEVPFSPEILRHAGTPDLGLALGHLATGRPPANLTQQMPFVPFSHIQQLQLSIMQNRIMYGNLFPPGLQSFHASIAAARITNSQYLPGYNLPSLPQQPSSSIADHANLLNIPQRPHNEVLERLISQTNQFDNNQQSRSSPYSFQSQLEPQIKLETPEHPQVTTPPQRSSSVSPLRNIHDVAIKNEYTPVRRDNPGPPTSSSDTTPPNSDGRLDHSRSSTPSSTKKTPTGKQFVCNICNRSFGYKHVLQNHERTHTGEKPFECKECHKRFTRDHHLKTHMRLHTGEKPYKCKHCDRMFVQVANLRRHIRVHTGEKPYSCEVCLANFSDSNQLKAHNLIHKGEKPHYCYKCRGSFRRKHHLRFHKCPAEKTTPLGPINYKDLDESPDKQAQEENINVEDDQCVPEPIDMDFLHNANARLLVAHLRAANQQNTENLRDLSFSGDFKPIVLPSLPPKEEFNDRIPDLTKDEALSERKRNRKNRLPKRMVSSSSPEARQINDSGFDSPLPNTESASLHPIQMEPEDLTMKSTRSRLFRTSGSSLDSISDPDNTSHESISDFSDMPQYPPEDESMVMDQSD